jgi:hypothetical protein
MSKNFLALLLMVSLPFALHASAGKPVQLAELTASDAMENSYFGTSIAASGNTVVVGAPSYYEGSNPGAAYVFVKPAGGWQNMTETAELTPSDGTPSELFGQSVAISGDTIVVGCNRGSEVYVFVKPAGGWKDMTETARLTASDGSAGDDFGGSVSIDGATIVVGASDHDQGNGAAYVFVEPSGGWMDTTQTAELTSSNGHRGLFGASVAIAGNMIVAGAPEQEGSFHPGPGAAYLFVEPSGGWVNQTQTAELVASNRADGDGFGLGVAVNASTIVVGAPAAHVEGKKPGDGVSFIFAKPAGGGKSLTETAQLSWGNTFGEDFGASNSISGNVIAAGVPEVQIGSTRDQGAAAVFFEPAGGWQTSSKPHYVLTSLGALTFGDSVAISGNTVLVGASNTSTGVPYHAGAAYVFGLE